MPAVVIVGAQWGDEGKGKATDLLAEHIDYVVKFNGGNNAGHTVVIGDEKYALHLLPSGILTPGVTPVISNGVVIDLAVLFQELDALNARGIDTSKLRVSANAHIITPYNVTVDKVSERFLGKRAIGTTGRGIGPTYADKINRIGIRVQDLFDESILRQKVEGALVTKNNLLTKVYFPRVIIPLSSVLAALVDFGISLVLLFIAMAIYRLPLTWNVLWVIPLTLLTVFAALAVGLWLSALNVQYRDVQQMVPFLIQIWMYATPIVYPITTIPEGTFRYIYSLNPMVGVVQGFRWAFFGGTPPDMTLIISSAAVLVLLVTGLFFFRRMEKTFADVV